ncbi:MAG: AraC family transcriptional regulator [Marinagarivorans sp.]
MLKLSEVLNRFNLSAQVFYAGDVCGTLAFEQASPLEGHMHLIKQGRLTLRTGDTSAYLIEQPSLVFMARSQPHQLRAQVEAGTQVVCASILYGVGNNNPLANAFPPVLVLPLAEDPRLAFVCTWLFDEAFAELEGRQLAINRLGELLVLQMLRHLVERASLHTGMLAGLAHPQLHKALLAIHGDPARAWSLVELANLAGMSRSKFAELFKAVLGQPPGDYLIEWRLGVAQSLLRQLKPVGLVAHEVGYENASVLARVFRKKIGLTPLEWLERQRELA